MDNKHDLKTLALLGIIGGMMIASPATAADAPDKDAQDGNAVHTEKNSCKGMNGCEGKDDNKCSGPGGCAGKTDKK